MRCAALVLLAGCSQVFGLDSPSRMRDAAVVDDDGALDLDGPRDMGVDVLGTGSWGTPELAFSSIDTDDDPTLTADMRIMFFDRGADVWMTSRNATSDPWGTPTKVNELSTVDVETTPEVNHNGLFITVASNRPNSQALDIWWSLRSNLTDPWPGMTRLANQNSTSDDVSGNMTADTLTFVFASNRPNGAGDHDLYLATRMSSSVSTTFDPPNRIVELSTAGGEVSPFITADGSELYFDEGGELYRATRSSSGWNPAEPVTELNTVENEGDAWVSPDERHIYFVRGARIYHASR